MDQERTPERGRCHRSRRGAISRRRRVRGEDRGRTRGPWDRGPGSKPYLRKKGSVWVRILSTRDVRPTDQVRDLRALNPGRDDPDQPTGTQTRGSEYGDSTFFTGFVTVTGNNLRPVLPGSGSEPRGGKNRPLGHWGPFREGSSETTPSPHSHLKPRHPGSGPTSNLPPKNRTREDNLCFSSRVLT